MKPHHGALRVGRMVRWQRWSSHAVLGACGASGLVWFLLMDAADWQPPQLVFWWVAHGITGTVALLAIGMALPHHVVATWRHHRNRLLGAIALAVLALLGVSALLLLYGKEPWHARVHWTHVAIGVAALLAVPLHVVRGRRSVARGLSSPRSSPS